MLFTEPCPQGASSLKQGDAGAFYQTPSTGCLFAETGGHWHFSPNPVHGRWGLTSASVDGGGAERLPHDGLADVCGDEQGDPRAQAIPLLQKFIQKQNNQASHKELSALKK